jgi:hypothetical protein
VNARYLLARLARHFMPDTLARSLLRRNLIIHPGLETSDPQAAASRYGEVLASAGYPLSGKRVLIFGYGGNFALGCMLLRQGAGQVVLCDRYAPPDHLRNTQLLAEFADYLRQDGEQVFPRGENITLLQADIRQVSPDDLAAVDYVFTTSVYEHLDDVEGITRALAALTHTGGTHLHYIDLRDHYFKYPFEMLTFSESTWRHWLNPTSNLNRLRLPDYQRIFNRYFHQVEIQVLASDPVSYQQVQARIRQEFKTGDAQVDAVTLIQVRASHPVPSL